jgi:hypothetical protein
MDTDASRFRNDPANQDGFPSFGLDDESPDEYGDDEDQNCPNDGETCDDSPAQRRRSSSGGHYTSGFVNDVLLNALAKCTRTELESAAGEEIEK